MIDAAELLERSDLNLLGQKPRLATNAGFDMGAEAVVLQASVMGEPIYRKLGYREITRYPWFVEIPRASGGT